MDVRTEFKVHRLSEAGLENATDLAARFSTFLTEVESICGYDGREMAIVRTKLQEASFFAKRALAERDAAETVRRETAG